VCHAPLSVVPWQTIVPTKSCHVCEDMRMIQCAAYFIKGNHERAFSMEEGKHYKNNNLLRGIS